jgi:hypothetical protein
MLVTAAVPCRLEEQDMPVCLLLPLQLEYAALCDCVGARGDTDRLASAALGISSAVMQDLGLAEMMVRLLGGGACVFMYDGMQGSGKHLGEAPHALGVAFCCDTLCIPLHAA